MNSKLLFNLLTSMYDKKFTSSQKIVIIYLMMKIIDGAGKYQSNFMNLVSDATNGSISQVTLKEKLLETNWFEIKIFPGKKNATKFYLTDKGMKLLSDSDIFLDRKYVA